MKPAIRAMRWADVPGNIALNWSRSLRLILRPTSQKRNVAAAPNPIPPSWSSTYITPMPKGDQYDPVSTTASPVTDTAEVEVKRALLKEAGAPGTREIGSDSKSAPTRVSTAKPR